MDETPSQDAPPAEETPQHRSARERQRRGPMWGCMKGLVFASAGVLALLLLVVGGGYWYLGTSSFAGLIALRIEKTLEARLGRDVSIHDVVFVRARPTRVIVNDLRIANSPGAVNKYFATVRQIEITGGVESFWGRRIKVGRVDIRDPRLNFEVYPAGSKLVHNFPHWQSGPRSRYEIYHLEIGSLFITHAGINFLDRKHDIAAVATDVNSRVNVTRAEDLYAGLVTSPLVNVRLQNYKPFVVDLRGGFRYTPGVLALQSIALRGRDMEIFVSGKLDPLTEGAYDLRVTSKTGLNRIREIFGVNKVLDGQLALDTRLLGKQGTFTMSGGWFSPKISADVYDLANARGRLNITDRRAIVEVDTAKYGGGTISAHYELPQYSEPYPMSVDLRYHGVSLEKLFSDWGVKDTGLRGGATGRLAYHWKKDKVLEGAGNGNATLAKNAIAFSNAKYPLPVGGSADFALNRGVVRFKSATLTTDRSRIDFSGSLRIEDINTDLAIRIHSTDFSELDRAAYNFARSAGKKTFTLLGLGGAGDISGTVRGPIKTPQVVAHIASSSTKYNNAVLGDADIDLRYDGGRSILTFDRATFRLEGGTLAMTGTVAFPDRGPSQRFDLAVDASGFPVERAVAIVDLPLAGIRGLGTGRLIVTGTPENGRVTFAGLTITQGTSTLRLRGDVQWLPGKGNVHFNLDLGAQVFPVAQIAEFLDLGTLPVTGELTGTLHLEGTKKSLEGAGAVTVRKGTIFGEPVDVASADILFTRGVLRATNVLVTAPAGTITGEAEMNLATDRFSYTIKSSAVDLSRLGVLRSLAGLLGGNITLNSTGAGTLDNPELVVEATLNDATIRGLALPAGSPPPTLYIAIRGGRLIVRGNVAGLATIEGDGTVGKDLAVAGLIRISVPDIARLVAISPSAASLPASGALVAELRLGGKLTPVEALRVDASFPTFNVGLSDHEFTSARPIRIGLRDGRIHFDDFELTHPGAALTVTGSAGITGDKPLAIHVAGDLEAALLQLFVRDLRSEGHIDLVADVTGTMTDPRVNGTAEVIDAQFRFAGVPQIIDHVNGRLLLGGENIKIEALRATVGGGTVTAGGTILMAGLKPKGADITLRGDNVAIRYFEGITLAGNFDLRLTGDLDRMTLRGDINVDRALYSRDFDFGTALLNVVLSRRSVTPISAASWQDRVSLFVHINAATPGTLAVRNNIADVTAAADLELRGTLANPVVLGLVTLDEGGRIRLQNVDYHVVRGSINFQNPFRIDPYFDLTIEGRVSGGGLTSPELESGPIDVTLNLTGTIDRFTPTITSDPPASDITLFSILGFGAFGGAGAGGGGVTAGTIGASLLTQSIGFLSSRILPFADTFAIDPGFLDTTNDPGTKVTFEKRLSNNVRLLVIYNLNSTRSRALVEWQMNPDWTLQLTRDEVRREFRAEARFRRRYAGQWSWGGNRQPVVTTAALGPATGIIPTLPETPPPPAPAPPPNGPNVVQVAYRADGTFDSSVLSQHVTVRAGLPLSIRQTQSSIKRLFATGDFRDVRVETTPADGGVNVTFVLSLNYRVGTIHFDGLGGADRTRAERDLSVHAGDVLSLNAVERSARTIQQLLGRSGFLEATVDPETTFDRATSRADVIFHVASGPRAQVGAVTLLGDLTPFTREDLVKQMKRGPGKPFRISGARSDAERMEKFLIRRNHRQATVRLADDTYDVPSKTVALRYEVSVGPIVKVEVTGVPRRAVRRVIPFAKDQPYSDDTVDAAAQNIVRLYQQRGYYNATVDTEGRLEGDTWITTFKVIPGDRFRLEAVTFTGNTQLRDKELSGIVQTSSRGGFRTLLARLFRRPTAPTRAQLSDDRDALESYYRLRGFSEAAVEAPVVATNAAKGTMTVDFPIAEGPQTLVRAVRVEGNEQVPARDLPKPLLEPGKPLNPQLLRADLVNLESFYSDRGNAAVQIAPRPEISPDKTSATITYVVSEGPKIKVDDVVIRGNTYTHTDVVLRKAEIEKGDPFSYTSILEAQRNLYRLGVFQRVQIQPELAGASVGDRNLVISVEEGKNLTVAGSVGMSEQSGTGLSPLGSASIAHRNLLGTGRYLGLELVGSSDRQEAFLTYREPFLGRYNIPLNATLFRSDERRPSAHIVQSGASLEVTKIARLQTRWSLRYEYRMANCADGALCKQAEQAIIPGINRSVTDINISSLTPTFFWDRRDDPTNPHRGFFTTALVEYAFPIGHADANFLKEFAQASYYLPVSAETVFAVSGRIGLIQPMGGGGITTGVRVNRVPYTERFTAGGESSHRAYNLDLLGTLCDPPNSRCENETLVRLLDENGQPTGAIAPVGGNGLFITNLEYRFPIFASVRGAVFTDIGNVFRTSTIDLGDLRWGVGTGIRYLSPVGPLRFDVGYKLRRQRGEDPFAYFLTLGYAF